MIAEFYIRLFDKADHLAQPVHHRKMMQAGDVIAIKPKGWCWGSEEISSPEHVVVAVDVESIEQAEADFLTSETFDTVTNPLPRKRRVKVDAAQFPASLKSHIQNKNSAAIKAEYESMKAQGKPAVFSDKTTFKIPYEKDMSVQAIKVAKT